MIPIYSVLIHYEVTLYGDLGRGKILPSIYFLIRGCYKHKTLQECVYSKIYLYKKELLSRSTMIFSTDITNIGEFG